jgi:hypothetical protein
VLLACALFSTLRVAHADEYDATFTRAIAVKERALDTNDPGTWEQALELFASADRIRSTKEVKYELGTAAARLHQDDLAVEAYEASIALGLSGSARDKAAAFVDSKKSDVGHVQVTGPEGATIYQGDRARGTLPLSRPIVLFSGKQTLRVALGQASTLRDVDVPGGGTTRLDLGSSLAQSSPPPAPTSAPTAAGPFGPPPPVRDGRPVETPDRTAPWVLTLSGAGLFIAGGVSVLAASSSVSSHRDSLARFCSVAPSGDACSIAKPGQRDAAQSEVDSIATWKAVRTGGFVGMGVGLVATGIGTVWLLSGHDKAPHTGFAVVPTRGGATLGVFGRM